MTAWLKDVIGYGTHAARPAAGSAGVLYFESDTKTLLRDNGSTWDVLTAPSSASLLLNYAASTDLASGTSLSADTWTNLGPSNSFTVVSGGSGLVMVSVRGAAFIRGDSGHQGANGARLLIDATTGYALGGSGDDWMYAATPNFGANPFTGSSPVVISGLSAAAHTVQVQVIRRVYTGTLYCRASSDPATEHLEVQVLQLA